MKQKLTTTFIIILIVFIQIKGYNQATDKSSDDIFRIAILAYSTLQIEKLPPISNDLLLNKLNQITTQNGLGADGINNRFIIILIEIK